MKMSLVSPAALLSVSTLLFATACGNDGNPSNLHRNTSAQRNADGTVTLTVTLLCGGTAGEVCKLPYPCVVASWRPSPDGGSPEDPSPLNPAHLGAAVATASACGDAQIAVGAPETLLLPSSAAVPQDAGFSLEVLYTKVDGGVANPTGYEVGPSP